MTPGAPFALINWSNLMLSFSLHLHGVRHRVKSERNKPKSRCPMGVISSVFGNIHMCVLCVCSRQSGHSLLAVDRIFLSPYRYFKRDSLGGSRFIGARRRKSPTRSFYQLIFMQGRHRKRHTREAPYENSIVNDVFSLLTSNDLRYVFFSFFSYARRNRNPPPALWRCVSEFICGGVVYTNIQVYWL